MRRVLLATCRELPDGEAGGGLLVEALAARGVRARWVVWDDPAVEWGAADAVAVRSTWDYQHRAADFLAWARSVGSRTRLLNGAEVFAWNLDKAYLVDLDLPHVPTALLDGPAGLAGAIDRWGPCVVKPRVGASGVGVVLVEGPDDGLGAAAGRGPWVVQPLVASVRTVGESSVFVLGGRAVSQVDKRTGGTELRVQEEYGGSSVAAPLDSERAALAERAVGWVGARFGAPLDYARIDVVRWRGDWVVSELELIEPGLYLDVDPAPVVPLADLVVRLLG